MSFSLLFVFMLAALSSPAAGAQAAPPPAGATFAEASRLAAEGRTEEALAAFQRLAAINPHDHEARIWIARMQERLGRPAIAEAVYRSVLLEDPSNVDAMVGVGTTLLTRHLVEDAIDILTRAEASAPGREDVLEAQGRAYREAGDSLRAISYFERLLATSPTERHRMSLEGVRTAYLHRVEARGLSEDFNAGTSNTTGGGASVNYRLNDRLRVFGRGEAQRKFGVTDQRGGGGAEWRWKPLTTLAGHALIGPDNVVMPAGDYLGEINHTYARASWTGSYRYLDFNGAWMAAISPAVTWWASERMAFGFLYAHTVSRSNLLLTNEHGNTLHLSAAYRYRPRIWLLGGYSAGIQDFETVSIDEIGDFRANGLRVGARWDLPSLTSITGSYDYQWRPNQIRRGRFVISLAHRF